MPTLPVFQEDDGRIELAPALRYCVRYRQFNQRSAPLSKVVSVVWSVVILFLLNLWAPYEGASVGLLTDYRVNGKRSLDMVQIRVKRHLAPFFAGCKAHKITTTNVQSYIQHRLEHKVSNAEINRELAA